MIQKKLQKGSNYNKYDLDGDGVVDDDELAAAEKLHEIEAAEKQEAAEQAADQQMWSGIGGIGSSIAGMAGGDAIPLEG